MTWLHPEQVNPQALLATLANVAQQWARRAPPPEWLSHEALNRLLLLANHVLAQHPAALKRLRRHQHKTVALHAEAVVCHVRISEAGMLLPLAASAAPDAPDLLLKLPHTPWADTVARWQDGLPPDVEVTGDVMLAAEIGWLREHVRWDIEEDMARVLGDVPAAALVRAVKGVAQVVAQWRPPQPAAQAPGGVT
ncbi:MAG: hypothetical protein O2836_02710 [Proteobacteria bacterium]|nr:hypothetical protein [Pseudomonadota bacterium]